MTGAAARATVYDVYLLGGQSNMDGRAATASLPTSPVNLQQPQNDVAFYYLQSGPLTTLRPATSSGTTFGPEITFGRAMANANPSRQIALIKYSRGGTSLAVDWKPGSGSDHNAFKATVTNGLAALAAGGNTYRINGMLWLQGESDAGANATNYGTNLTSFIADMRASYGANMPFVIGGTGYGGTNYPVVNGAQEQVAATVPNVAYFSNYDLLGPDHNMLHFDAAGEQVIGQRFATAIQAVPEPGLLGLAGLLVVGLGRRRGRRGASAGR
ncbi:MAG TPA: sialate O-acetylesterase [Tepidisphaeraceae bacterium]|nr:sialate O-acetylesterase [Tepidisphaeraceae bacterium]